ncbi:hypothetical protein M0804_015206 [Polistes exclamans]|nr:hypothetical protein M0804_015206 [Polistes exclamans]
MLQPSVENTSDESDDNQNNDYFEIDQNIISGSIEVYDSERNNLTEPTTSYGESLVKQSSSSLSELRLEITRPTINDALLLLNQSPLLTRRQNDDTYLNNKITRVAYNLRKALGVQNTVEFQCSDTDAAEIIEKLREKFNDTDTSTSLRLQILTLMPSSWSIDKIVVVMGATMYMARLARKLAADQGVLPIPEKKIGVENIKQLLLTEMDNNGIDEVSYKQWVSTPKVTLETTIKSTLDFVDDFCEKLVALLPHNFIAKEQAAYLRALKEFITENEFIVIVDFAENYAFVVQDAAQEFHWNNDQATVYTVVIYYKVDNQLTHQISVVYSR